MQITQQQRTGIDIYMEVVGGDKLYAECKFCKSGIKVFVGMETCWSENFPFFKWNRKNIEKHKKRSLPPHGNSTKLSGFL